MRNILFSFVSFILAGCHGYPAAVTPVSGFELERYLGKWYEIARLDHSFERGLERVTAEYSLGGNGKVKVVNRGFAMSTNEWKEAIGKAYLVREADEGYLKVSFFGPFYSSYVIFGMDHEKYQYAFISGPSESYLWLLSRTPSVDKGVLDLFIKSAERAGFDTDKLIYVPQ
ncbi:lipocalin family protein [Desulfopila sp. IMCC35008]|uniref:lipocalin family protein n=1 Tax=Desulfopila sp. IMCC35008 TaxID=2653858 RepID=UPI0013D392BC|nr:lipocalin family protein [Desulfopila sp. IMCC35008]